jgi:hypothetical protein
MFVSQLLLPNVKMWDQIKVESLFPEDVVKAIFNVPLFDVVENDKLIWVDYANYSVKSGYKKLLKCKSNG